MLQIEGQIFLFDLGQDCSLWEKRKKQMRYEYFVNLRVTVAIPCMRSCLACLVIYSFFVYRCDQYRWVSKGVYSVKSSNHDFKKRSNWIDVESAEKGVCFKGSTKS